MRVIAHNGGWYVIETSPERGRIFDRARGRLFPEMTLAAITARGSWSAFTGDHAAVLKDAL